MNQRIFFYGESPLSTGLALEMAAGTRKGILNEATRQRIEASRQIVAQVLSEERVVYGVTTGFGPLCTTVVSPHEAGQLQENLLMSHSVGVGPLIPPDIARLMLILKVQALAQGYSGIGLPTLERICWHIDADVIPCVPAQGSVGASGDLAPLSHLFLPLIGLGEVFYQGKVQPAAAVLQVHGLEPLRLQAKEGLALINGTQFMAAYGLHILARLPNCLDHADLSGAMMLEALAGSAKPFDARLHAVRPHPGSQHVAARLRNLLAGSEIMESHINCKRVQDPYSLRCIPQVHGASRAAWLHLKEALHIEINSVTDNPVLFDAETILSGGNFHGQPIALPLDYAAMAAAEIGNIADRRIYLALDGKVEGIPKLLIRETGLHSGFMIPQYTTAALVTENKTLCFPASVDSVPTSMGQEDHVSMGSVSARKALRVVENLEQILGIELLYAAQALDFRRPLRSSVFIDACHAHVRQHIDHRETDRPFSDDIQAGIGLVRTGALATLTETLSRDTGIPLNSEFHESFRIY